MRRRNLWLNLLRVGLSLLALVILLNLIGGAEALLQEMRTARWPWLGLACGLFVAGIVIRAYRWRALLHGLDLHPPFRHLLELYLMGSFFNTFLPSGFGGDAVRILELAQGEQEAAAVGTVLVDRMTGLLSSMALGLLVLPFAVGLPGWLVWLYVGVSGGGLLAGFLLLEGRLLRRLTARLPGALSLAGQGKLAQIYAAVTGAGWGAIGGALALSTLFNGVNILIHWLCARAVGIEQGLPFYFVATPLLSLTLLLPISVGGLGARDGVAQVLFNAVGVPHSAALAMSLSVYLVTAAASSLGGVLYLVKTVLRFLRRPKSPI